MIKQVKLIKGTITTLTTIQDIGRSTFYETFSSTNGEQDMALYLNESFSTEKLTKELNNPESHFFLAMLAGRAVGYLKLNTGSTQSEPEHENAFEIERIYVLAAYHGQKVGQLLYNKALQIATALHAGYIWLGVWEENQRALHFYQKNGFVAFDKHAFILGNDIQTDIMMKKILKYP